jgi:hypothetical protein
MNLAGLDAPRYHDLPTLCILGRHELGCCLRGRHPAVALIVMAHPDALVVGNPEVHSRDWAVVASLQFPQPLVRDIEIAGYWNSEYATGKIRDWPPQTTNAIPANPRDSRFGGEVHEHRHSRLPLSH